MTCEWSRRLAGGGVVVGLSGLDLLCCWEKKKRARTEKKRETARPNEIEQVNFNISEGYNGNFHHIMGQFRH